VEQIPGLAFERAAWEQGHRLIVGIDEAGRGAWAGPVVAAAVVLPSVDDSLLARLSGVRDSKLLSAAQRERCYGEIMMVARAVGVGSSAADEIDKVGIVPATRAAMLQAVDQLCIAPDFFLIDALTLPVDRPQRGLIKGDRHCLSIAAASIIAKVTRDRWMVARSAAWPAFGMARNKGYGTPEHRRALDLHGPTAIHRYSYAPVRLAVEARHG
jgi:ribonuclease HII